MNDPRQRIVVDAISFGQVFRFQRILSSITQAMQPPRLVVALFIVISLVAVGNLWDALLDEPTIPSNGLLGPVSLFDQVEVNEALRPIAIASAAYTDRAARRDDIADPTTGNINPHALREAVQDDYSREFKRDPTDAEAKKAEALEKIRIIDRHSPKTAFQATAEMSGDQLGKMIRGVFQLDPVSVYYAFYDLVVKGPMALWAKKKAFFVVFGLFSLLVVSIGGGALCRMAACEIAGRERLRVWDGFNFALRHWVRLVLAPTLPLIIAGILTLILVVLGVVFFWIPWVDAIGGLAYIINIIIGFIVAFVLLAYFASFPMVLPSVATECADPADAMQRAFAYLLSKPLHYLGYLVVGLVGLSIGYFVVALIAVTTLNLTAGATSAMTVAGDNPALVVAGKFEVWDLTPTRANIQPAAHNALAAGAISFWQGLIVFLVAAYVISFICTASTHIYMLMRKAVDNQDYSDIWRPGLVPGTLAPMPAAARPFSPPATTITAETEGEAADTDDSDEADAAEDENAGDDTDADDDQTADDGDADDDDTSADDAPKKKSKSKSKKKSSKKKSS